MHKLVKDWYRAHENTDLGSSSLQRLNGAVNRPITKNNGAQDPISHLAAGFTPEGPRVKLRFRDIDIFDDVALGNLILRAGSLNGVFMLTSDFNPIRCVYTPGESNLDAIFDAIMVDTPLLQRWQGYANIMGQGWGVKQALFYAIYRIVHCFDYDLPMASNSRFSTPFSAGYNWPYTTTNPLSELGLPELKRQAVSLCFHLYLRVKYEGLAMVDAVLKRNVKIVPSGCNNRQSSAVVRAFGLTVKKFVEENKLQEAFNLVLNLLNSSDIVSAYKAKSDALKRSDWILNVGLIKQLDIVLDLLDIYYFITQGFSILNVNDALSQYNAIELTRFGSKPVNLAEVKVIPKTLGSFTVLGLPGEATVLTDWRTCYNRPAMIKYLNRYLT